MAKLTVSGIIATTPRGDFDDTIGEVMRFRLCESVDDRTNWFTILFTDVDNFWCGKGDTITVTGELQIRDWDNGERAGTVVEILAEELTK